MMRDLLNSRRIEIAAAIGILLLSLGLRWRYWQLNPLIDRDSALYCYVATVWSQTGDFRYAYREFIGGTAPLYIFLLKIGVDCGIPVIIWGRILSFLLGGAFVFAFYLLGKELFPMRRDGGLICMLLGGIHPIIGRISIELLREGLFVVLAAFAMAAFVRAFRTRSASSTVMCGLLLGAATMTRHEGAELLILAAAALLPWFRENETGRRGGRLSRFRQPLCLLLGAMTAAVLITAATRIPVSFLTNQYLSKLDNVKLL